MNYSTPMSISSGATKMTRQRGHLSGRFWEREAECVMSKTWLKHVAVTCCRLAGWAVLGGLVTAGVAFVLAIMVLIPPWSRFFGLDGEFDGLLLFGLPLFAVPGGMIAGALVAGLRDQLHGRLIAMTLASLPAAGLFFSTAWANELSKNARDQFARQPLCHCAWRSLRWPR